MREQAAEEKYGTLREQIFSYLDDAYDISDEELMELIRKTAMQDADSKMRSISEREQMERELFHSFRGLDILQELLDDPDVTEILVNGARHIFYEKQGSLHAWEKHIAQNSSFKKIFAIGVSGDAKHHTVPPNQNPANVPSAPSPRK